MQTLQELIEKIAQHYSFTAEHYPSLAGASAQETFRFAVAHNALHMAKTAGKIAAWSEDADHGAQPDAMMLREQTYKMFINVLRLSELQGMAEKDLFDETPKFLR